MNDSATAIKAALGRRTGWLPSTFNPAQILVLSFAAVIAVGTAMLSLPAAVQSGPPLRLVDALFTATSATCVTGLTVVDTGTRFSRFGQIVILCCIQIGGLGLMTFTTVFLVATGRRLAIADRIVIQESFHHSPTGKLGALIRYIVVGTLVTEALGAAILTARWWSNGTGATLADAAYSATFHAISAFCNAGFSLYPDNLIRFQSDPIVIGIVSALIIAGGLGFLVGLDIKEYVQQRFFTSLWPARVRERVEAIRPRPRLSLHSKLVLTMTGALLAIGSISYYGLERLGALAGMTAADALLNAWFCSVTARTAGFNSIDYADLGGPALLCTMVLMFIGASPGSAGGGVKTSTFGLLLIYALYRWRGQGSPHAFRRSIPQDTLDRASTVVVAAVGFVIIAGSFLMATEARSTDPLESQSKFLPVLFETFSGFGTVGLSMGLTGSLSSAGRVVLCVVMFVGRVGPLTLALALANRKDHPKISYAEENVMVG
jgi:trk system potassium uptake protein TrkH